MILTIYTPCYNKGTTIQRTFDSLLQQSCHDFEWIVVNDGSTDNSKVLIDSFITDLFPINKIHKENEGLSSAMNIAVENATGQFVLRLDSDDFLKPDAVETILHYIKNDKAVNDPRVGALVFLTCYEDDTLVGTHPFANVTRCNFWDYRQKYKAVGDRAEVFKTDYFRKFPMPQFPNEKFCMESYVWNHFSDHYDAIYYPQKIYVREYLLNSITMLGAKMNINNPKGTQLCLKDYLIRRLNFVFYFICAVRYWRFCPHTHYPLKKLITDIPITATLVGWPLGTILYFLDKFDDKLVAKAKHFLKIV